MVRGLRALAQRVVIDANPSRLTRLNRDSFGGDEAQFPWTICPLPTARAWLVHSRACWYACCPHPMISVNGLLPRGKLTSAGERAGAVPLTVTAAAAAAALLSLERH